MIGSKRVEILELQTAVERLHNCAAHWLRSEPVHETLKGKLVWEGDVEVFGLLGHPKALRAYAWAQSSKGKIEGEICFATVLEIPPVHDAQTAVQASIKASYKSGRSLPGEKP